MPLRLNCLKQHTSIAGRCSANEIYKSTWWKSSFTHSVRVGRWLCKSELFRILVRRFNWRCFSIAQFSWLLVSCASQMDWNNINMSPPKYIQVGYFEHWHVCNMIIEFGVMFQIIRVNAGGHLHKRRTPSMGSSPIKILANSWNVNRIHNLFASGS